jgi:hypothetical protein
VSLHLDRLATQRAKEQNPAAMSGGGESNVTVTYVQPSAGCAEKRQKSPFGRKRFADEIAGEPSDDDVFAELGDLRAEKIFDRNVRIFDESLLE